MLAGRLPFAPPPDTSPDGLATALEERLGPPPEIRPYNADVPPAAEAIVRRLLQPDPAKRYSSARRLQKELARWVQRPPVADASGKWLRRPLGPVWQVGLITTLLVVICWLISLWMLGL